MPRWTRRQRTTNATRLLLELADGRKLVVVQIAGLVARRIVPFVSEGQILRTGERFGLIRFGSRLDVYLPDGVEPLVALGQTMVAGETVLARTGPRPVAPQCACANDHGEANPNAAPARSCISCS